MGFSITDAIDPIGGIFGEDGFLGGDPEAMPMGEVIENILDAITLNGPQFFEMMRGQVVPDSLKDLEASELTSPRYAQLNYDVTSKYAPMLADVENKISQTRKLSDAAGDLAVVKGPGRDLAKEATALGRDVIDPEFFANRAAIGNKQVELINSLDPNKLSGGEQAEVERSVNADAARSGNVGNNVGINAVGNAMHFGNALNKKRESIGAILNKATEGIQNMRSGIDYFGRAQTNAPYTGNFQPVAQPNQNTANTANNLLNNATKVGMQEQDINANRRDSLDRVTGLISSV